MCIGPYVPRESRSKLHTDAAESTFVLWPKYPKWVWRMFSEKASAGKGGRKGRLAGEYKPSSKNRFQITSVLKYVCALCDSSQFVFIGSWNTRNMVIQFLKDYFFYNNTKTAPKKKKSNNSSFNIVCRKLFLMARFYWGREIQRIIVLLLLFSCFVETFLLLWMRGSQRDTKHRSCTSCSLLASLRSSKNNQHPLIFLLVSFGCSASESRWFVTWYPYKYGRLVQDYMYCQSTITNGPWDIPISTVGWRLRCRCVVSFGCHKS